MNFHLHLIYVLNFLHNLGRKNDPWGATCLVNSQFRIPTALHLLGGALPADVTNPTALVAGLGACVGAVLHDVTNLENMKYVWQPGWCKLCNAYLVAIVASVFVLAAVPCNVPGACKHESSACIYYFSPLFSFHILLAIVKLKPLTLIILCNI